MCFCTSEAHNVRVQLSHYGAVEFSLNHKVGSGAASNEFWKAGGLRRAL